LQHSSLTTERSVFSAKLPQKIIHEEDIDAASGIDANLKQLFEAMKPVTIAWKPER